MPIRRFRTLPDEDEGVWMPPDRPELLVTIGATWALAARLCPQRFPPGVYKHRSIEDANRRTEEWERETIRRQAAART